MCWNPHKFKILGIWFTYNLENIENLNLNDKFFEIQKLMNIWLKRTITPIGRTVVLKSLILSKLIHLWILLPNPPDNLIKKLQSEIFNFVWENKKDKIKRKISIKHIKDGGLNIPDIALYIQSLKLTWMKKIMSEKPPKWKHILEKQIPEITNISDKGSTLFVRKISNPFWADFFKAYNNLNTKIKLITADELLAEPLFDNNKFKIGGQTFHFNMWARNEINTVKSIVNENGSFMSFQDFQQKYNFNPRLLDFLGCISTVKKYAANFEIKLTTNNTSQISKIQTLLLKGPKGSKHIYNAFIDKSEISKPCKNWERLLEKKINWADIFTKINRITEVKLKWFQLKICQRILVTNSILKSMGIIESDLCNFCTTEKDTIIHYMWKCTQIQSFWKEFEKMIQEKGSNSTRFSLTPSLVLFGTDDNIITDEGFDSILIQTKFFIHKCRINKIVPQLPLLMLELKHNFKIEKHVHQIQMTLEKFNKKWLPYHNIFNN